MAAVSISSIVRLTHLGLMTQCVCQWISFSLFQVMDCHVFGANALQESVLSYCELDH